MLTSNDLVDYSEYEQYVDSYYDNLILDLWTINKKELEIMDIYDHVDDEILDDMYHSRRDWYGGINKLLKKKKYRKILEKYPL